jgi:DNA polymerase-1
MIPSPADLLGKTKPEKARTEKPEAFAKMACYEAYAAAGVMGVLKQKLEENGMLELYRQIEIPVAFVLADMEREGVRVDGAALREYGTELAGRIRTLEAKICEAAGEEFNINCPKQLGEILFEKLYLPYGKKTKTGWSTNADVLEKLQGLHPIVGNVLEYRMLTKLKSTYADGLLKVISPDGRIHTSFQMTVTATGRLSSTEPNLQNIPVRKQLGSQIRRMFIAPPGSVLVDADYSQIELRLLAHISQDQAMIDAFLSGEDFHAVTASNVFRVPLSEVTHAMRSSAKAVNFGIVYGISAFSLSQDIGVSTKEAQAYIDAYFQEYSGVHRYMTDIVEKARADGYVTTLYGRRRDIPELKNSKYAVRQFGERVALNMPIQGTAADIMKLAMIDAFRSLEESGLKAKLVLQVHDELIVECPEEEAEQVSAILEKSMSGIASLSVPLVVDVQVGHSWAEAH